MKRDKKKDGFSVKLGGFENSTLLPYNQNCPRYKIFADDIQSLAILIYRLFAYQPPKKKASVFVPLAQQEKAIAKVHDPNEHYSFKFRELTWNGVSAKCKEILRQMLAEDPIERPTIVQVAKSAWLGL